MGAPRPLSSGSTPDFTALRQQHPTIWVGGVDLLTDPTADGSLPVGQGIDVCVNAWINGVAHGESRQLRQASSRAPELRRDAVPRARLGVDRRDAAKLPIAVHHYLG